MRIKTAETLGELVRDQRKQRGWSQSRLAEKVGVSRLWVGQFENGKETVELGLVLKTLWELRIHLGAHLLPCDSSAENHHTVEDILMRHKAPAHLSAFQTPSQSASAVD